MVENCDTMLEILHKHKPFERIRDPENCDFRVIFFSRFFSWPRNYYNDNNVFSSTICLLSRRHILCTDAIITSQINCYSQKSKAACCHGVLLYSVAPSACCHGILLCAEAITSQPELIPVLRFELSK